MATDLKAYEDTIYVDAATRENSLPQAEARFNESWLNADGQGMALKNPTMMLAIYDDNIRAQRVKLYNWQIKVQRQFAESKLNGIVNRLAVLANNGSGKSQFTIAPCAVWLAMAFKKSRAVVTSASGTQLDRQVGKAILNLCRKINEKHGAVLWKCNYRYLTFLPTGSTIELYATDDPGKAEGYHAHDVGCEFAIFMDEAKSVPPMIHQAVDRCNDKTRVMFVSSPGGPTGDFYTVCHDIAWWTLKVTYHDCPHISQDEVEYAKRKYGETSAWFKSAYLAEFCSSDELLMITWEQINKCRKHLPISIREGAKFAGLDLSQGGDETVLVVCQGNTVLKIYAFRFEDTTESVEYIKKLLHKEGLDPDNVYADDGGFGKSQIDMLHRDGYKVHRTRNESVPSDNKTFANRGSEMWYNLARLIIECDIVLIEDQTLFNQLATRYYSQGGTYGRIQLESKRIARSHGHGSPDRADALVLAFSQKRFPLYANITQAKASSTKQSIDDIIRELRERRYAFSGLDAVRKGELAQQNERIFSNPGMLRNN